MSRRKLKPTRRGIRSAAPAKSTREPEDSLCFVIADHLWVFFTKSLIFLRMPLDAIPMDYQQEAEKHEVDFITKALAFVPKTPPLEIHRGCVTKLGGLAVDGALLDMASKPHGELLWYAWDGWFLAKNQAGEVVALWKLPKGAGLHETFIAVIDGALWACTTRFVVKINPPAEQAAKMREIAVGPAMTASVAEQIKLVGAGTVYPSVRGKDYVIIGSARVPAEQFMVVEATCGKGSALEWLYMGPGLPVGARRDGSIVAFVAPMVELPHDPSPLN